MQTQTSLFATAVRWTARIGSLASIVLLLTFLFGEGLKPEAMRPTEWLGLLLYPGGIILGMIVGWRSEGWGAIITLVSLLAFYTLEFALQGEFPRGPFFLAFALPGLLFGLSWWLHGGTYDRREPPRSQGVT